MIMIVGMLYYSLFFSFRWVYRICMNKLFLLTGNWKFHALVLTVNDFIIYSVLMSLYTSIWLAQLPVSTVQV